MIEPAHMQVLSDVAVLQSYPVDLGKYMKVGAEMASTLLTELRSALIRNRPGVLSSGSNPAMAAPPGRFRQPSPAGSGQPSTPMSQARRCKLLSGSVIGRATTDWMKLNPTGGTNGDGRTSWSRGPVGGPFTSTRKFSEGGDMPPDRKAALMSATPAGRAARAFLTQPGMEGNADRAAMMAALQQLGMNPSVISSSVPDEVVAEILRAMQACAGQGQTMASSPAAASSTGFSENAVRRIATAHLPESHRPTADGSAMSSERKSRLMRFKANSVAGKAVKSSR